MRDQVRGDGIRADYHQRERPATPELHFGGPVECRQEEEAEAAAEERPRRRPDAFHDRADAGEVEQKSGRDADGAGGDQAAHEGRLRSAHPLAGREPQDHGAEGWNKAERQISAIVFDERLDAREEVEEPDVESVAEVVALIPVRQKSAEDAGNGWIERPSQPVTEENHAECGPLPLWRTPGEQEKEWITEADLRQRVLEGEVGLRRIERAQKDAQI